MENAVKECNHEFVMEEWEDWRDMRFLPALVRNSGVWVVCYSPKGGRRIMRWTLDVDASKPMPHWRSMDRTRSVDLDDQPTCWLCEVNNVHS